MKCLLLKNGTECGADLSLTQEFCGNCGGHVEIDESKIKKCPKCSKRLRLTYNFCTVCCFSFEDVTKQNICEGKKEDGTKCNHELSPSDRFCSTCDIRLRKEDVHDRGNDQNQTDEKNKDQTEEKNKDQTEAKNKDQTEEINKDQTEEINKDQNEEKNKDQNEEINKDQNEEKNKDQTDELDGRDDENRPEEKTEKQKNEAIENTTQKPIFYEPSAEDDEPEKRGLAVVCSHSKFIYKGKSLPTRDNAWDDHDMMKSLWDLYGCHVIDFEDERSDFYNTKLIEKIHNELEKIENIEIFVFVLSSHGEEREPNPPRTEDPGTFQHYFFTKDGQCNTQDLMNKIANIEKLESKLKIFVIQACRGRAEDENEDHGVEIEIESGKDSDLSGGQNDDTFHYDAEEYTRHEDEKKDKPNDKREDGGKGRSDAKPDDKRQNDGIDLPDAMPMMMDDFIENFARFRAHLPPVEGVPHYDDSPVEGIPHCDDCVVMFASMSGKYAYSKSNHQINSGGWLIKSVDKILKKYEKGDQAHILDILVEINREVGTRESEEKRETCEIPNLDLEIKMENLQSVLKSHVKKLCEICSKHSSIVEISKCQDELNKLATEIDKDGHTEVSLNRIKKETVDLTEKFKQKLQYVMIKSQSSFLHNVAFDDEDLILCRIK